jgi:hypothetical protein
MFVPFFRPFDNIEPSSLRLLGLKSSGAMRLQAKNTLANNAAEAYQNACRRTLQNIGRLDDRSNEMLAIGYLGGSTLQSTRFSLRFDLSLNSPSLSLFN